MVWLQNVKRPVSVQWNPVVSRLFSGVQVKYKASKDQKQEGSSDLPNLLQLEHALNASKLQSNVRHTRFHRLLQMSPVSVLSCVCLQVHYKKKYEQTKAQYHLVVDTAEQLHHKENAVLHSQVPIYVIWQADSSSARLRQ